MVIRITIVRGWGAGRVCKKQMALVTAKQQLRNYVTSPKPFEKFMYNWSRVRRIIIFRFAVKEKNIRAFVVTSWKRPLDAH